MSPSEANDIWSKSLTKKDERIAEIITMIIKANGEGLPCILNRNPTINYGSVLHMYCVGFTDTLTISIPLQVLKPLGADFDGKETLPSLKHLNCWKVYLKSIYTTT